MTFSEFHFIRPYWLLAFLPLIIFIILRVKNKLQQGSWQSVCDAELLPFVLQEKEIKQSRMPLYVSSLAAILSIIALAGPTWQRIPTPVFRNAAALVIALDLSRSMDATDIKPSRLARARYKISDLLTKRKDGQTALVVYANSAFTVTPLTDDTETINSQLSALTSDIMPAQGSNSAAATQLAVQLFKNAGLQQGQVLLITDADSLAGVEMPAGYQLSILAVGTPEGAPIKLKQGGFLKDASGNIVLPKLNTPALRKAAQAGGGIYQQITATDKDIDRLSAYFDQTAERSRAAENDLLLENWVEAGVWLLLPVLLLSAVSFRRGLLSLLFILLLPLPKNSYAIDWQDLWQTKEQQAQQHYIDGNYQQAAEKFANPAWRAAAQYKANTKVTEDDEMQTATTDTGFYNQGNVLAKSGQLDKAITAYDEALKLNPDNKDAQFNKDLVEKELEKQKQQQQNQDKDKNKDQNKDQSDQQQQDGEPSENDSEQQDQQGNESEQQADDAQQQQNSEQQDAATEQENDQQAEQASAESSEAENQQDKSQAQASETDNQQSEQQQANEQWLNRIPDDPAGLLKRKFKYQYGRQQQRQNSKQQW
ncbi:MAG: hypothetical protein DRQ62_02705 [Gammaproteobacteria bacterium]|nr:MAG: hypothetical protein DRQ62_02705 [Gammaproteobacteria bacterium]